MNIYVGFNFRKNSVLGNNILFHLATNYIEAIYHYYKKDGKEIRDEFFPNDEGFDEVTTSIELLPQRDIDSITIDKEWIVITYNTGIYNIILKR